MADQVCSIEGCGGTGRMARGMCWAHYMRWYSTGDPGPAQVVRRPKGRTCSVDGCERKHQGRGYCDTHLRRFMQHGDPGPADIEPRRPGATCSVDGCGRPHAGLTFCDMHYQRFKKYGSVEHPNGGHGQRWQGEDVGYVGAHQRVAKARGKASLHACVDCGGQAQDWSYDHADPNEKLDAASGKPYSTDVDHYVPRCKVCHRQFDAGRTRTWTCSEDGCDGAHKARGLCSKHYQRWRTSHHR